MSHLGTKASGQKNKYTLGVRSDFPYTKHLFFPGAILRLFFFLSGMILILYGGISEIYAPKHTVQTLFLLDNSLSMAVEDITTESGTTLSRFEAMKELVKKYIKTHDNPSAIMTFAKNPILRSPFTDNTGFLIDTLDTIRIVDQSSGTDMRSALLLIRKLYLKSDIHIVLITDGGGELNMTNLDTFSVSLDIIGVGTSQGGNIPLGRDLFSKPVWKMQGGEPVVSRINTTNIETLRGLFKARVSVIENSQDIEKTLVNLESHNPLNSYTGGTTSPLLTLGVLILLLSYLFPRYAKAHDFT